MVGDCNVVDWEILVGAIETSTEGAGKLSFATHEAQVQS